MAKLTKDELAARREAAILDLARIYRDPVEWRRSERTSSSPATTARIPRIARGLMTAITPTVTAST